MGQPPPTPHEAARALREALRTAQMNLDFATSCLDDAFMMPGEKAVPAVQRAAGSLIQGSSILSDVGWRFYEYPDDLRYRDYRISHPAD